MVYYLPGMLFFVIGLIITTCTQASTIFELELLTYNNPTSKKGDNTRCDGDPNPCDPAFYLCIDTICGNNSPNSCLYMKYRTPHKAGDNIIFEDFEGLVNPIVVFFTSWPGEVLFKVDIWDGDGVGVMLEWMDQMHAFLEMTPAHNKISAVQEEMLIYGMRSNDPSVLNITYTAYCETDHYGPQCDVLCVDSDDDVNGHYTCHPDTGAKICLPGWTDISTNCTVSIDDCVNEECQNFALCEDSHLGYKCICLCGTTGTLCETNIDDCASFPCQNGATCVDGFNKFTCQCPPNFTGTLCDTETSK